MLLGASLFFYAMSSTPWTFIYVLITIVTIYLSSNGMMRLRERGEDAATKRRMKAVYLSTLLLNLAILAALKYTNFLILNLNFFGGLFHAPEISYVNWPAALGVSYYTLQAVSYLTDVYWGVLTPWKNPLKTALYICFFPQMVSGPISRFPEFGPQLDTAHAFSFDRIVRGFERILWGFFKKLVIAEKLAPVIDMIYDYPDPSLAVYLWFAVLLYPLRIYCDFSGCMDIVLGAAELFGIKLPENFNTPFFSRTIQEFWQRWHISLGLWLKNYVMFPLLRTKAWARMGETLKKRFGKKAGKQIPLYLAMLVLWACNGVWHGNSWKYIVGVGLWFWLVIVIGQIFEPAFRKLTKLLHIPTESLGWHIFQSVRTYLLYAIGALFFCAKDLPTAFTMLGYALQPSNWDFRLFAPEYLFVLGADGWDYLVVSLGLLLVLLVSVRSLKGSVRDQLAAKGYVIQGTAFLLLLFAVLLFGSYGIGYEASSFIYAVF